MQKTIIRCDGCKKEIEIHHTRYLIENGNTHFDLCRSCCLTWKQMMNLTGIKFYQCEEGNNGIPIIVNPYETNS